MHRILQYRMIVKLTKQKEINILRILKSSKYVIVDGCFREKGLMGANLQVSDFQEANLKKAVLFSIFNTAYFSKFRQHENL